MKHLLLVGGGHSHVEVIRRLSRNPPVDVRVTLVSPEQHTAYSGMLPGLVAGHYTFAECHIDLDHLCRFAKVGFHRAEALGIDPQRNVLVLDDGATLRYDVVSINIGSTPPAHSIPGALGYATRVKPVPGFLHVWDEIRSQAERSGRAPRIAVIGGGAGGVELALALHYRLNRCCPSSPGRIHVFTDGTTILPGHAPRVVSIVARILAQRDITVNAHCRVTRIEPGLLHTQGGERFVADQFIFATGASASPWIAESGVQTDDTGFIVVNAFLQSVSHPNIFAAGDIASRVGARLPKSGVFAVRQGPPLAMNLHRALNSRPLIPYRPQHTALALISAGNQYAVASYGGIAFEGAWVWRWKDFIDRRFVGRYHV